MVPPPEVKTYNSKQNNSMNRHDIQVGGSMVYSHGTEVYHKPRAYDLVDDAGFNLQKLAWVEEADTTQAFARVRVVEELSDDLVVVEDEDGGLKKVLKENVFMMNPPKFDLVDDMAELLYLHEPAVVHNLTQRYKENIIYTYSGLFLVAVNPYRNLPIYSTENIRRYRKKRRGEMPPHIYAIADHAFHDMLHDKENQSILITGESGAGKTENTKIVIQYLASIAGNGSNGFGPDHAQKGNKLEQQILQANPILEAFGNAQTVRNNNSSRFGKFIRIAFNRIGDICGAFIDWYLLETSRVHSQSLEERNYHIFYQLLSAEHDMKVKLGIDQKCPADYTYTVNSNHTIQGVDDAAEYKKLARSMDIMGITQDERLEFFRVIVAILCLGNIEINSNSKVPDIRNYEDACLHLGISAHDFKEHLPSPQIKAGNEWVKQAKSASQVKDILDALSKVLYERNFNSLVNRINSAIDGPQSLGDMSVSEGERYIGVLDIAGFEIFKINSFEQLCINYTNEKLQDFFNQNMFVLEEKEYKREHIHCDESLDYRNDLQPTINLIENSKTPIGILSCLEDKCVTQGTDDALLDMIVENNKDNPRFKQGRYKEGFSIKHYAGEVKYSTTGWVERGKDPLNENIARLLAASTNSHVASLFKDYADTAVPTATNFHQLDTRKPLQRTRKGGGNFQTVGYKHKQQLSTLMTTLQKTHPHFVRCILPNDRKRAGEIQPRLVLHQLRCNGVLEGIRICRVGYPNRIAFEQFHEQYRLLAPALVEHVKDHRKACQILLDSVDSLEEGQFQIGRTKVFFKAGVLGKLEKERDLRLSQIATKIQAACLGMIARRKAVERQSLDKLIRIIQRNSRVYINIMQSKLWRVHHRREEFKDTYGIDDTLQQKSKALEQVLSDTQARLKAVEAENESHQNTVDVQKKELEIQQQQLEEHQNTNMTLEKERDEYSTKCRRLEQELEKATLQMKETKQLSDEQANMLSKIHKDLKQESEENDQLTKQNEEISNENKKLKEQITLIMNDTTISDELQAELDSKEQRITDLERMLEIEKKKNKERDLLYATLQNEMKQYKGEFNEKSAEHDKIKDRFTNIQKDLEKETEERHNYQKKAEQLKKDVSTLTHLVQTEAKESRERAERFESIIASVLKRST